MPRFPVISMPPKVGFSPATKALYNLDGFVALQMIFTLLRDITEKKLSLGEITLL